MTNEEIYNLSPFASASFPLEAIKDGEKLVHLVSKKDTYLHFENPNGSKFFAGNFDTDRDAYKLIDSLKTAFLREEGIERINYLSSLLEEKLPVIDGIKYAVQLDQAFLLAATRRPMDDIYVIYDEMVGADYAVRRLIEYVSRRYAS